MPPATCYLQPATCAVETGAKLTLTESVEEGVTGVDFIHTDVWVSVGEADAVWAGRIALLKPYQVNGAAMALTGRL